MRINRGSAQSKRRATRYSTGQTFVPDLSPESESESELEPKTKAKRKHAWPPRGEISRIARLMIPMWGKKAKQRTAQLLNHRWGCRASKTRRGTGPTNLERYGWDFIAEVMEQLAPQLVRLEVRNAWPYVNSVLEHVHGNRTFEQEVKKDADKLRASGWVSDRNRPGSERRGDRGMDSRTGNDPHRCGLVAGLVEDALAAILGRR